MNTDIEIVETLPPFPARPRDAHKGTCGRVCIVGGSLGMMGAPTMAAEAALRIGAGLVTVAASGCLVPIIEARLTEAVKRPIPGDARGLAGWAARSALAREADRHDAFAVGPGLGTARGTARALADFLPRLRVPVVIDADALNIIAGNLRILDRVGAPWVITPHPGEFSRLTGHGVQAIQSDRMARARAFAASRPQGVLVLKGHGTIVAQGNRVYRNTTGNPGMATGGSGDVLTGMIAGLIAQGLDPFQAACLGVYLHGLAGDVAARNLSEPAVVAGDLIRYLPAALREHGVT